MDRIEKLAERLYILIDPWDREYAAVEELAEQIKADPIAVIEYLTTQLEEV